MKYWKELRDKNNFIYSCDMLRLTFSFVTREDGIDSSSVLLIRFFQNLYYSDIEVEHYDCFKDYKFRHLFVINLSDDVAFTVGILFNGPSNEMCNRGFIEFNPNKCCGFKVFKDIFYKIHFNVQDIEISRYDLAIDIPVARECLNCVRAAGEKYQFVLNRGSQTEYLRSRNKHNFTKVYDKRKESNLDYDLTRVEITVAPGEKVIYPSIYCAAIRQLDFDDVIEFNDLNSTYKVLVQLLQQCPDKTKYLRQLSRNTQQKLKPFISDDMLKFDENMNFLIMRQLVVDFVQGFAYT